MEPFANLELGSLSPTRSGLQMWQVLSILRQRESPDQGRKTKFVAPAALCPHWSQPRRVRAQGLGRLRVA